MQPLQFYLLPFFDLLVLSTHHQIMFNSVSAYNNLDSLWLKLLYSL